ncbi:unnamed protein product [Lathyrus oleraceus]
MNQLAWCITIATTKKLKATGNGWYYPTCYNFPKVAKDNSPSYVCSNGHSIETEIYRYKIKIAVVDNESIAIFCVLGP